MDENSRKTWKTKHGVRRVRHEEPTLEEAVAAARGLSDDSSEQLEIAASLIIGMPADQVRSELLKLIPSTKQAIEPNVFSGAARRGVIVEHKRPRRVLASPHPLRPNS